MRSGSGRGGGARQGAPCCSARRAGVGGPQGPGRRLRGGAARGPRRWRSARRPPLAQHGDRARGRRCGVCPSVRDGQPARPPAQTALSRTELTMARKRRPTCWQVPLSRARCASGGDGPWVHHARLHGADRERAPAPSADGPRGRLWERGDPCRIRAGDRRRRQQRRTCRSPLPLRGQLTSDRGKTLTAAGYVFAPFVRRSSTAICAPFRPRLGCSRTATTGCPGS